MNRYLSGCVLMGISLAVLCGCASHNASYNTSPAIMADHDNQVVLRPGVMFSMTVEAGGCNEIVLESCRLQEEGTAVLPLIGSVSLLDETVSGAVHKLQQAYLPYFVDKPLVRLQLLAEENSFVAPWGKVTVLGRVKSPGQVALPPTHDMTISGAIQKAGGFDTSANLTSVRVSRQVADDHKETFLVNIKAIGMGATDQDVALRSGDVVFVPERRF